MHGPRLLSANPRLKVIKTFGRGHSELFPNSFLYSIILFFSSEPALEVSPRHRVYQELSEGKAGNISCRIEGNVASYRWVLPNRKPLSSRMRAVGNILTINPVLRDDAGTYSCVAQGGSNNNQIVEAQVNVTIQGMFTSTINFKILVFINSKQSTL